MNFECKKMTITDDPDFGCTIDFCDTVEEQAVEELFNPRSKYLTIQKSYPDEEYDDDWYSIETSEGDLEFNQRDLLYVTLNREIFRLDYFIESIVIGLNLSEDEFIKLDKTLRNQFKDKVLLNRIG